MNTLPELDWGEETKSLSFTSSSVITHRLGNINDNGFELSKMAEGCALELISKTYPQFFPTFKVDLSEGKNTDWDGILGEWLVEIKYSAKSFNNTENRFGNFFETHYKDGSPSALLLSKADYYITISPGWHTQLNSIVGKVRMWNVKDLIEGSERYPRVEFDYGEYGFYVNKKNHVPHEWLGDVSFDEKKCEYNMTNFIRKNGYFTFRL